MFLPERLLNVAVCYLLLSWVFSMPLAGADLWDAPAFTASPEALRQAAGVEKPDVDSPGSNYVLAQQRLAELKGSAAPAKSAGR